VRLAYHHAVPPGDGRLVSISYARSLFCPAIYALPLSAQDSDSLSNYFIGKEVVLKIDMPGSQQGVDLSFNKDNPMNWKQYSSRLKANGVAIRKGDTARITGFVVKNDRIEFQLDGGGFGTFFDDSSTTVNPRSVDKSDYERKCLNIRAGTVWWM
jgi:hypothetical protein